MSNSHIHPDGPVAALKAMVASGKMHPDPKQLKAAERLEALTDRLKGYKPQPKQNKSSGFLARLGLNGGSGGAQATPKGLYVFGPVGRGKSMLMDLVFDHADVARKRRVHFHAFMQDVQKLAHARRQSGKDGDPIPAIAKEVADTAWLLAFDEFQVDNIADAMTLGRLFEGLFNQGVVVVATSNAAPTELYKDGLQRDRFLPFLDIFAEHVEVMELDGGADYRLDRLKGQSVYHVPPGPEAEAALAKAFADLTDDAAPEPLEITVRGRKIEAPKAARGVAWFTFEELCKRPYGPADYLAMTEVFHTLIISGIPVMKSDDRNEARRLVTCIDACYEHKVNVICSAEAKPDDLYVKGVGDFEFRRCASRLIEMQAEDYMRIPHVHGVI